MNLVVEFIDFIRKNIGSVNEPVKTEELSLFQKTNNILLPLDLRDYFGSLNGFPDGELLGLSSFWPLHKLIPMTQLSGFGLEQDTDLKKAIREGKLFDSNSGSESKVIDQWHKWQIQRPELFFVFGDYNINSCYWAINLSKTEHDKNEIICIYDWGNNYRRVATSFSEFIYKFMNEGEESLI